MENRHRFHVKPDLTRPSTWRFGFFSRKKPVPEPADRAFLRVGPSVVAIFAVEFLWNNL